MRLRLAVLLEGVDAYTEVFDPYVDPPELVSSLLSDDLTAIASDARARPAALQGGPGQPRRCGGGSSPTSPRGAPRRARVLRALQSVVAHDRLDAEFESEQDQVAAADEILEPVVRADGSARPGDSCAGRAASRLRRRRARATAVESAGPLRPTRPARGDVRGHCRAEVRRLLRRRRRGHQAGRPADRRHQAAPATTWSSSSRRWATPPTS